MSSTNHTLLAPGEAREFSRERKQKPGRARTLGIAFLAICHRDFLVARREFVAFLFQFMLQPFFFLFIFGKVLPMIGTARPDYAASLLPGMVALTTFMAACQGLLMSLVLDLGQSREIDDRLLAPLSIHMVALEKVLFATLRGILGGAMVFPLAAWMLGNGYQVRGDDLGMMLGFMALTSLASSAFGLVIGAAIQPKQLGLIFGVVFIPLIFTGCVFYPWVALYRVPWFMVLTLLNPLTYASEGLRATMMPLIHGSLFPTLSAGWVVVGLSVTTVIFLVLGMWLFYRRVVN
jgi:ABC-2 type transport system permease protein